MGPGSPPFAPPPYTPPHPPPPPPVPPRTRRRRRWPWVLGAAAVVLVLLPGAVATGGILLFRSWAPVSTVGTLDFANELRIPPLAEPRVEADGTKVFPMHLQAGSTSFRPGPETPTWGVDGTYLAPTIRADRGDRVRMEVTNDLDQATTLHWHGMHLPAAADGGPHQLVPPGATWTPSWTIDQPAASLWFHPHLHEQTAEHVTRGIAGMFLVDDPAATDRLHLPGDYGVDDVPVIVQDRTFDDANRFTSREPLFGLMGSLGDQLLVNGTWNPHLDVTTERVRLRLLNASNARTYRFTVEDGRELLLIGTDGGLLPHPAGLRSIQLSPGERTEVVVAMAPGERAVIQSRDVDLGGDGDGRFVGGADAFDVLQLRAADDLRPSPPVPDELVPAERAAAERPDEGDAVTTRTFRLDSNRINGQQMAMDRVDQVVTLGATEVWEVTNEHDLPHSFHAHLVQFAVLTVDGRPPPPELSGLKDTVAVPPGRTLRLAVRFDDYADPDTPFMFHCHILRHEDNGMMGQFVVVAPGEDAGAPSGGHEGHRPR